MRVGEAHTAPENRVGTMREGILEQRYLLQGRDDSPSNYLLNVGRTGGGGWSTPRHRHPFDQVRYVLKGRYPIAKGVVMEEGSVGYFPEGVYYGPQDRPEGLEMMVCQFGGASGQGFLSPQRREAANAALEKKGQFKDGVYTYFDENGQRHNIDGSEACYQEATGKKTAYGKPRYENFIVMDPAAYEWIPANAPGVHTKRLGTFTERDTQLGLIRVDAGSSFSAGLQASTELLFLSKGAVSLSGRDYGPYAAFEFLANEGPIEIEAKEATEFLSIVLPRF
ncbi:MAG TPA: hypothetical protein VMU01_10780 [Rhizomicrobium sp.]|nr:hypothetical protein [Alphaproteobacteria bacterium]HUO99146.1 hypothetical protein [Rhizomicrobium sp.]